MGENIVWARYHALVRGARKKVAAGAVAGGGGKGVIRSMSMPVVAHKIDALVRERPGITKEELRNALGTDVDRALRRLVRLHYVRQVRSGRSRAYYYPIEGPSDGDTQAN